MSDRPTAFTLQLTEDCNLSCLYCYVRQRSRRAPEACSLETCDQFVEFALANSGDALKLIFFGGEPLLFPDLIRHTIERSRMRAAETGKEIAYHIYTNGTLLEGENAELLVSNRVGIEVSIDGPAERNDRFRMYHDGGGSFDRVYGNLLAFRTRYPDYLLKLFAVISDSGVLPWLLDLKARIAPCSITFNPLTLSQAQEKLFSGRYVQDSIDFTVARIHACRDSMLRGELPGDSGIVSDFLFLLNGERVTRQCQAGINSNIVTQTGDIYPCTLFIGKDNTAIGSIWTGYDVEKRRPYLERTADTIPKCAGCRERYVCAGGCAFRALERNGDLYEPYEGSCVYTRAVNGELRKSLVRMVAESPERLLDLLGRKPDRSAVRFVFKRPPVAPTSFVVRLTGACNLSCGYCYEGRSGDGAKLTADTAEKIMDYIIAAPTTEPFVSFFGGEPLANGAMLQHMVLGLETRAGRTGKRPSFHVVTNGTLIDDDMARFMARHRITVQFSIDGDRESHDRYRRTAAGAGSYAAVLEGLERLKAAGAGDRVDAQVVLTPQNTDMVSIATHLKGLGFRRITFQRASWTDRDHTIWSAEDIRRLIQARAEFYPFFLESARNGDPEVDLNFASLVAAEPAGTRGLCECGRHEVYVDTDGDIYLCPRIYRTGEYRLGNCADATPDRPFEAPARPATPDPCVACWALDRCDGGCIVTCQQCPYRATVLDEERQTLWCDLVRADIARAMLTHLILEREAPVALARLKETFAAPTDPGGSCGQGALLAESPVPVREGELIDYLKLTGRYRDTIRGVITGKLEQTVSRAGSDLERFKSGLVRDAERERITRDPRFREYMRDALYRDWLRERIDGE